MVEGIAKYGVGFKPPSMHELKTWILREEVEDIDKYLLEHKKAWEKYGCSIMSDGWTDGNGRVLLNFLVNSPAGTFFLKSIDASGSVKNGSLMLKYLDEVVREVGEENVVQIITDNASNYKNAGLRLMQRRLKLWWTPCAAHCIDFMLEDISKLIIFEKTIASAKKVVKFLYGHTWVLSLMREFTNNSEIIRPAVTRFATSFLTLQSIYNQKQPLQMMFNSKKWIDGPFVKSHEGIGARAIVLFEKNFWSDVAFCVKGVMPLVCVLREVDSEVRPAMGYIYELIDAAKEKIAFGLKKNPRHYQPIWNKIDARWTPQLHQPLHAAIYFLNPQLHYEDNFSTVLEVKKGLHECMDRMMSFEDRLRADIQLEMFDKCLGEFGSKIAIHSRKLRSPVPLDARGIGIHTKKKNRLEHKRLNALVYVKYNSLLRERNIRRRVKKLDPILVEEIDSDDEWISEVEDPILPNDLSWLEEGVFEVEAIRNVPIECYEQNLSTRVPICVELLDEPTIDDVPLSDDDMRFDEPSYAPSSKRKNVESSSKEKSKSKKKMKTLDSLLRNEDEIEDLILHPHIDALNIDDVMIFMWV
ncbi:uncharacterized protein LOC126804020 [Argentina anserina]|uniref:uncharacterized protein LOC126804020 n=1 Tax=Argentina anserina TaxID=57926 RepID=UPI0021766157|nr:uncharacterized protein LOC126804020 [Potentilla anserina]